MTQMNDTDLDAFFAVAQAHPAQPSPDLMARVLADAISAQPQLSPQAAVAPVTPGFWARLMGAVGGGAAFAGLATATVAGFWVGFATPDSVAGVTDSLWTDTAGTVELIPSFDALLTEG